MIRGRTFPVRLVYITVQQEAGKREAELRAAEMATQERRRKQDGGRRAGRFRSPEVSVR